MKISDVPQDSGISEDVQVVSYATGEDGRYVKVGSKGWEPINVANGLAWQEIAADVRQAMVKIQKGKLSVLAYYMAASQMDVALLARYTGFFKWRVRRHLQPQVFAGLKPVVKKKYAALFKITLDELQTLPEHPMGENTHD